tara:strand:+ start:12486 stop:15014 length:2529 start_codon:yes stop_codon:yes gene_type:complete
VRPFLLIIFLLYLSPRAINAQQNSNFNHTLNHIDELYFQNKKFQALQILNLVIDSSKHQLNFDERIKVLQWVTLLSFELDYLPEAKASALKWYLIDNDFSVEKIPHFSQELKQFIDEIIVEQDKDFVFVNKHKQETDFVPANVTVYNKDDINDIGARDLLDLLRLTSGFMEIGDNNERNFSSRGVFGTTVQDVLILVNGHNINDLLTSSNAPDWLAIDYIEQIEIVRGPGSALYGGNAFSAVINIITKTGKSYNENSVSLWHGSGASDGLGLFSQKSLYRINHQFGKKISKNEEIYISSTLYHFGGSEIIHNGDNIDGNIYPDLDSTNQGIAIPPKQGLNAEYVNQYNPSYNLMGVYKNKSLSITANAQSTSLVLARPLSQNLWEINDSLYLNKRRTRTDKRNFIELQSNIFQNSKVFGQNLVLKASYDHFYKDFFNPVSSDNITSLSRLSGNEHRGKLGLEYATDRWGIKNRTSYTVIGLQSAINTWYYKYQTANKEGHLIDSSYKNFFDQSSGNSYETNGGFYFQTEQSLVDKQLILTLGFRINYHDQYANLSSFKWGHDYSPRMALVYIPKIKYQNKNPLKFKLFYNSAFLPPPFLYRKGGINAFRAVDSLTTQNVETIEGLIFGDIGKNLNYSVNFYRNSIHNFITKVNGLYDNLTDQLRIINGLEMSLNYKIKFSNNSNLNLFANSTFLQLKKKSNEKSILNTFSKLEEDILKWTPSTAYNVGVYYNREIINNQSFLAGLNINYQGLSRVSRSYYLDTQNQSWVYNTLNDSVGSRMLLNINFSYKTNFMDYGFVIKNLLNKNNFNYLPSIASQSGRVMGESRIWYIALRYYFNRKRN